MQKMTMRTCGRTKIWYHVDDLGASEHSSEIILDAWEKNLINSVSILANGDALNEVKERFSRRKDKPVRISAHLNISEGKGIIPGKNTSFITDGENDLISGFGHILKSYITAGAKGRRVLLREVADEWDAQILKIKETVHPRKIDVLDGHIHIHMLPFLFPVTVKLALKHGVREIRITRERFFLSKCLKDSTRPEFPLNIVKFLVLNFLSISNRRLAAKNKVGTPECYVSVLYTGIMTKDVAAAGIEQVRRINGKSVEVVFHIGQAQRDEFYRWRKKPDVGLFYLSKNRADELDELIKLRALP